MATHELPELSEASCSDHSELELGDEERLLAAPARRLWSRRVKCAASIATVAVGVALAVAAVAEGSSGARPQVLSRWPQDAAAEEKVLVPPPPAKPAGKPWAMAFDCGAGFANWQMGWSPQKMTWCCQHGGKGCRGGPPAKPFGKPFFHPGVPMWCQQGGPPPAMWEPNVAGDPLRIKVLTYNLFWWNLFRIRGGMDGAAGHLIQDSSEPEYDFMGFQECEDLPRVLTDGHMEDKYTFLLSPHSLCLAFKTADWTLISQGDVEVAEDKHPQYYGRRSLQYVRVTNKKTGKNVLFMNHHGPLPISSGGICGGAATASNILRKMRQVGAAGDAVFLVGDFNAGPGSGTISMLDGHLKHVYSGVVDGGIDNIYTNLPLDHVAEVANLGGAGSDHDALSAVLVVGGPTVGKKVLDRTQAVKAVVHGCKCDWAAKPGSCGKTDGSPCWEHCCAGKPAEKSAAAVAAKEECKCVCDWAQKDPKKNCMKPDATCCAQQCCAPYKKELEALKAVMK